MEAGSTVQSVRSLQILEIRDQRPKTILSHLSLGTNHYEQAVKFYEKLLVVLGIVKIMEHPGATGFGREFPEFWIQIPINGRLATVGNGSHVSFLTASREEVDRFYQMACALGAKGDGAPGPRPHYGEAYYGTFLHDLDGHKIEAMYWEPEVEGKLS